MTEQQKKQEPAKAEAATAKTPEAQPETQKVVSTDNTKNGYLEERRAQRAKAKGAK